ncbi:phosphotransferase [Microbacterium sp. HJ5]
MAGDDEQPLAGGNMDPVVRVGDTVRRATGPWTAAVHTLLRVLRDAGIAGTPQPVGFDDRGREILTYLDGGVLADSPPQVHWSESVLSAAGSLLRRIHDASVPLVDDRSLVWRAARHESAEVVCHNDFATYNLIVREGVLAGVIDFDFASPGPRVWDLAYLAYRIVPFAEDAPSADGLDRAERLRELIRAYGVAFEPQDVRAVAAERLRELAAFTRERAQETGRVDFLEHAAMYERDAAALRAASRSR